MSLIKLEPIALKLRREVPASVLFPPGMVEAEHAALAADRDPGGCPPLTEPVAEFLAHYLAIAKAASALLHAPQFASLARWSERIEEEYMPGGPPMSPVYDSFSSMHVLCSIPTGPAGETPISVVARITFGDASRAALHQLAREMASSHLDLYRARSVGDRTAELAHVRSGRELSVHLSGPFLREADLFLGRALRFHTGAWFMVDSPYLLAAPETDWLLYFGRIALGSSRKQGGDRARSVKNKHGASSATGEHAQGRPSDAPDEAHVWRHLKHGTTPKYWLEYIADGYLGERNGIVILAGVPDRPETLPHNDAFDPATLAGRDGRPEEDLTPLERLRRKLWAIAETHGIPNRWRQVLLCLPPSAATLEVQYEHLFRAFCIFSAESPDGMTPLAEYAASGNITREERELIEALRRGWFSVFEVRHIHLDQDLEVLDLLRNRRLTIVERSATRQVGLGDVLAGWVMVDAQGTCRLEGGVVLFPRLPAPALVARAKEVRDSSRSRFKHLSATERLGQLAPTIISTLRQAAAAFATSAQERPQQLPEEIGRQAAAMVLERLRGQLDVPIPMLGSKSLRQAARNPATRPDAVSWLREQERILRNGPQPLPADLRPLWTELGLEYQGLETDPKR